MLRYEASGLTLSSILLPVPYHTTITLTTTFHFINITFAPYRWESEAKMEEKEQPRGFLGTLLNLLGAVGGGAHIVKDEFGET